MPADRLYAFDAPRGTVPRSDMVVGLDGEVTIPTGLYLIEHREGRVLFDTGLAFDAFDDPVAVYGQGMVDHLRMQIRPEQRIDRQLARIGLRCGDITHVIMSHAHLDHTGSLDRFPTARFYTGPGELAFAESAQGRLAQNVRLADLEPTRGFAWTEVSPVGLDLFGDGSVLIEHAPGHTPGQLVLVVSLAGSCSCSPRTPSTCGSDWRSSGPTGSPGTRRCPSRACGRSIGSPPSTEPRSGSITIRTTTRRDGSCRSTARRATRIFKCHYQNRGDCPSIVARQH
ncbi:N-acyl homoserine lactonase family protein [Pseudonocardia xishanensis]|uniref:Metallo-beta-lactamase domain-containing protein n=1 Tax=Pseudonocardia xishanensis TaxID=630995 RepID=A0ABP8RPS3_9PSEU